MSKKTAFLGLCVLLVMGLMSCDSTPITAPPEENITVSQGIPTDQIQWVSWKPEVIERMKALAKGSAGELIIASEGGTVGGEETFGNKAEFPAGALTEDTYVTVDVTCVDGDVQCGAGVDFLPSMEFLVAVTVTLSYGYLDYEGDPLDLEIYWSNDHGATWFLIENFAVDSGAETAYFDVNHFTRFGWGL